MCLINGVKNPQNVFFVIYIRLYALVQLNF